MTGHSGSSDNGAIATAPTRPGGRHLETAVNRSKRIVASTGVPMKTPSNAPAGDLRAPVPANGQWGRPDRAALVKLTSSLNLLSDAGDSP